LNCLRRALGDRLLLRDRASVWLDPSFQCGLTSGVRAADNACSRGFLDDLTFFQLYEGSLLADLYDEWIVRSASIWPAVSRGTLQAAHRARSQSEFGKAIELAQRVLVEDPANERAHQHLMFCYAARGDRSAALRQYGICCQALRDDLDVPPSLQTDALYRWIKETREQTQSREASSRTCLTP